MWHAWEKLEMHTKFSSEKLKRRDHSEELGVDGRIILGWILSKWGGNVCTGCIWLRIETSGKLF